MYGTGIFAQFGIVWIHQSKIIYHNLHKRKMLRCDKRHPQPIPQTWVAEPDFIWVSKFKTTIEGDIYYVGTSCIRTNCGAREKIVLANFEYLHIPQIQKSELFGKLVNNEFSACYFSKQKSIYITAP